MLHVIIPCLCLNGASCFCDFWHCVLSGIKPFVVANICLKRLRTAMFESFEPYCFYRVKISNECVGTIATYRVYQYMIRVLVITPAYIGTCMLPLTA